MLINQGTVPPFVSVPAAPSSYGAILAALVSDGWRVKVEGPSGAQLERPRVMLLQTKIVLGVGIVLLLAAGLGLLLIAMALADHYSEANKAKHYFLQREAPAMPDIKRYTGSLVARVFFALMLGLMLLTWLTYDFFFTAPPP